MHTLLPNSGYRPIKRKVNCLVFVTAKIGPLILPHLLDKPDLNVRIVSDFSREEYADYLEDGVSLNGLHWIENLPQDPYKYQTQMNGHVLARWADFLFVVADASMISLILTGITSDVILHTLRCWDVSKRIVLLPELSTDQHRNPMSKRQLSKLRRKWEWINVLEPATWSFSSSTVDTLDLDEETEIEWNWEGPQDVLEAMHSESQTVLRRARTHQISYLSPDKSSSSKPTLPPEIWTTIFDNLGDWELATALGMYTHLPVPMDWQNLIPEPGSRSYSLEWTILTQPLSQIKAFFERQAKTNQPPTTLSSLASKLIFRFSLTDVLSYLASHQKDIFWADFGFAVLPHKASLIYNSPSILTWWKDCPAVIKKEYDVEAVDGASRAGFIEVLQWWLDSGLTMCYTDRALESASARGLVEVLEWWHTNNLKLSGTPRELPLKVGKSILLAAQSGRTNSIAWWERSGIPYSHEERVATIASQHGHVKVLELWHSLKGSKMIFDNQVLVGATKNGHAGVLEWWKEASRKYGLRVEYKTCDIEEAMEDAVGGGGEGEVREWWSRNGLNLGVGTREWMKVKTL